MAGVGHRGGRGGALLLLLLGLLLAAPARAETRNRPLLGVGVEGRYDGNALGPGGDMMTKLYPQLGWELANERLELQAVYAPLLVHHLEAGNFTFDQHARLSLHDRLSRRFLLRAEGIFYRVEDTSTIPRFGVARLPGGALWSRAELAARYLLGRTSDLEASYQAEVSHLFVGGLPLGVVHTPALRYFYRPDRRLQLTLGARGQLFADGLDTQGRTVAGEAMVRYRLGRHTFVEAGGGPLLYLAGGERAVVPRGTGELGYAGRRLALGFVVGRDLVGAAGYASAVWADFVQGYATWRAREELTFTVGGGYYRNGLAPAGEVSASGFGTSVSGELRLARGLFAHGGYDYLGQTDPGGLGLQLARHVLSARLEYRNW